LGTLPHLQWPPGAGQACKIEEGGNGRTSLAAVEGSAKIGSLPRQAWA
jgi:hypothetical protein